MTAPDIASQRWRLGRPQHGKNLKCLPALCAFAVLGVALCTIQTPPPRAASAPASDTPDKATEQTARAADAGKKFLATLSEEQRARALLDFKSPKKSRWSNLPVTMVPRNGVRMGDLSKPQRDAAMHLLAMVLSKDGYQKVVDIMDGDQQLVKGGGKGRKGGKGGKDGGAMFGKSQYYLALFGEPSATQPWMVQFGGHHLGVNVTLVARRFVLTPTHTGTQPAEFTRDGKTIRPLGGENDNAFDLIGSLDDKQRAQAVLGNRPLNLVLGPGRDGKRVQPEGIKGSELSAAQQRKLLDLIAEWVTIAPEESASARMAEIKANLPDTYFAWSGPTARGSAAYFRVQGPTLVIEYAPQGSTDHIHTVIRDPSDDYGAKWLR
jgi:hypothetical protein